MAGETLDTGGAKVELLTATFHDRESAERALETLMRRGYARDDVSIVMTDETRKRHYPVAEPVVDRTVVEKEKVGSKAAEGGLTGAAIGGTAGAVAGALAIAGSSMLIPGLGLIIAGPIVAALAGLGAGGAAGGLIGTLIGAGIPEHRAKVYETDLRDGRIVMGVRPRTPVDADAIEQEWRAHHGVNVYK
jgi:hypothetical protein